MDITLTVQDLIDALSKEDPHNLVLATPNEGWFGLDGVLEVKPGGTDIHNTDNPDGPPVKATVLILG